jgi:predicted O-methyltransferase YrrM
MLEATRKKLEALYAGGEHRGTDGKLHAIDPGPKVMWQLGEELADFHSRLKPHFSVEVGLAYGFSTLFILDAMQRGNYGQHVAIDPFQTSLWHGIGLQAVKDARLGSRFKWIEERSAYALSRMERNRTRAQVVYIDGSHLFDNAIIDLSLSDQILDIGGVVLIDDLWMPAVQRMVAFVEKNMACYERLPVRSEILAGFRKTGWDERPWDHYVEF